MLSNYKLPAIGVLYILNASLVLAHENKGANECHPCKQVTWSKITMTPIFLFHTYYHWGGTPQRSYTHSGTQYKICDSGTVKLYVC